MDKFAEAAYKELQRKNFDVFGDELLVEFEIDGEYHCAVFYLRFEGLAEDFIDFMEAE